MQSWWERSILWRELTKAVQDERRRTCSHWGQYFNVQRSTFTYYCPLLVVLCANSFVYGWWHWETGYFKTPNSNSSCLMIATQTTIHRFTRTNPLMRKQHPPIALMEQKWQMQQKGVSTMPRRTSLQNAVWLKIPLSLTMFSLFAKINKTADATPNGLAMNLPILHDISCISYKDYKRSK